MKSLLLIILLCIPQLAFSVEIKPYKDAQITVDQWKAYHDLISEALKNTREVYPKHHLEVYSDDATRSSIVFTMPSHPAHPAWVTRHVFFKDGMLLIGAFGYFAGDENAFKILFGKYQRMVKKATKHLSQK